MLQPVRRTSRRAAPAASAWVIGLSAAMLVLAGCGGGDSSADKTGDAAKTGSTLPSDFNPTILRRGNGPEPDTLDPQLARTEGAFHILRDVFEGLTSIGPDGSPVPAAAESWTVTPDGLEYRFTLRDGLRWSNGDVLQAADYVAGMRRLVDPKTASPYAQFIDPVLNAGAITRGERKPEELGVTAPDARTVLIRLATPAPYLLGLLSQPGTFPVHGPSLAAHGAEYARRTVPSCWRTGSLVRTSSCAAIRTTGTTRRRSSRKCISSTSPTRAPSCGNTARASSTSRTSCRRRSSSGSSRTCRTSCTSRPSSASITTAST
jgi:ABC-type oligopeptide transport system substrate-binding subunit